MNTNILVKQFTSGIRKEAWEFKRSLKWFPIILIVLISTIMALGLFSMPDYQENRIVDVLVSLQSPNGEIITSHLTMSFIYLISMPFVIAAFFVQANYSLSSLYDDRRDMSVYFWRSLPVSDSLTVVTKLFTTLVVIPAVFLLAASILSIIVFIALIALVGLGIGNTEISIWPLIVDSNLFIHLFSLWWAVVFYCIWLLPLLDWFMLASAYAKRAPFLIAILPIALIVLIESVLWYMFSVGSMNFSHLLSDYFSITSGLDYHSNRHGLNIDVNAQNHISAAQLFSNKISIYSIIMGLIMVFGAWWLRKNRSQ